MMGGKSKKKTTKIEQGDLGTLMICALRYCHDERSYISYLVQGICRAHLQQISDKDLQVMINDCASRCDTEKYEFPISSIMGWIGFYYVLQEEKRRRETR